MKKVFTIILLSFSIVSIANAQSEYQPYSYQFYQKLNEDVYSTSTREHTAIKPYFVDDSLLRHHHDSLMNYGSDGKQHSWGYRKLFNEHLIDIRKPGSTFYADLLPDFGVGRDFSGKENTSITSLGAQVGGTVGNKIYYNISGYQSSAVEPLYVSNYINQVGIIPGQAYAKTYSTNGYDWSYVTAVLSYTPSKYLNITAGRDKTFIGDGYRSELLSDYASPYPFAKLTATLGNVRYMVIYAYMNDPVATSNAADNVYRKKFAVFHYLDWNISNRLTFGFFDSLIGYTVDDKGTKRPFDFSLINPLIFLRTVDASNGSPDNALIGLTGKYKINDFITAYGQFALDEFQSAQFFSNTGSSRNKYGWQLGFRGSQMFNVKGLNYLLEYNTAKPYTYSEHSYIENYSDNGEPLAHPWGANFRELVGLLNYSYKRFDFSGEADLGRYGYDLNGLNYGKDIFELYTQAAKFIGNYTGQGITTNLVYLEGKVAYVLNPKYNLRIELGAIYRTEDNSLYKDKTTLFTIGLRSSFRNLYSDITGYQAHK
ncbi:MAG: hypothetical protein JWQ84_3650 [Mucilaginibacter sp.]|nr:hypothetical protein [Mucilaginibacter sp.]